MGPCRTSRLCVCVPVPPQSCRPRFLWLLQVLDHLEDHLKRSQYFRFLWFPHSENVSVIYQDPTNKAGAAGPGQEGRRGRAQSCIPQHGYSWGSASPQHPPSRSLLSFWGWMWPYFITGEGSGGPGVPFSKPVLPSGVEKDAVPAGP